MKRFFIVYALAALPAQHASGQYEKLKQQIDNFYSAGLYEKSKQIADSIEPLIRKDYGPASLYYGAFVCAYQATTDEKNGDFTNAELHYKKGMQIIQDSAGENQPDYMEACINLGNMYWSLGLFNPALAYTVKGRELLRLSKFTGTEAYAAGTNNLANIYSSLWQYSHAENLYDTTMVLIDSLAKTNPFMLPQKFSVLNNRAALYYKIGDFERADYYYQKTISLGKTFLSKNSLEFNTLLNNYGINLKDYGRLQPALEAIREVKNNIEKGGLKNSGLHIAVTGNLIETLREQGKTDSCLLLAETAIHEFEKNKIENAAQYNILLVNYARTLMGLKQWQKAAAILNGILSDTTASNNYPNAQLKRGVFFYLADLYLRTKKYTRAVALADSLYSFTEQVILKSYDILPENEKTALLSLIYQVQVIYTSAFYGAGMKQTELLEKLYRIHAAWKGLLLQKQAAFMTNARAPDNKSKQLYLEWKGNRQFLYEQYKLPAGKRNILTDSIAIETDKIESRLNIKANAQAADNRLQTANGSIAKTKLAGNECLIEFFRFAAADTSAQNYTMHYGAFLTVKNRPQPRWFYIGTEKQLAEILHTSSSSARVISNNDLAKLLIDPRLRIAGKIYPADKLYRLFWKPMVPFLTGIKKINCICDGLITQIPLHALPVNTKKFLADYFSFKYLLSHTALVETKPADTLKKTVSLWGGMRYTTEIKTASSNKSSGNNEPWKNLAWSKYEIKEIEKSLGAAWKCNMYVDSAASEENFRAASATASPGILHLSTHGYFNTKKLFLDNNITLRGMPYLRSENPLLNCGLAMAGANNHAGAAINSSTDGILTGYEIATLPLDNTGLVVLSACESGLGNIWQSEGVFGLQRAFKLAGANKIIMSLWQVPDKETAELMIAFYKLIAKGKTIEDAFEEARLNMRKKYPSPWYWAGFVLVQ